VFGSQLKIIGGNNMSKRRKACYYPTSLAAAFIIDSREGATWGYPWGSNYSSHYESR